MGLSILIVDDSMVARMAIRNFLKDTGAALAEAASGEAALGLVDGGLRPDLVFLDLTMPGIGGIETLKALRLRIPGSKVVVVTADVQSKTSEEVSACGAFAIVRKPADKTAVLGLLAQVMEPKARDDR